VTDVKRSFGSRSVLAFQHGRRQDKTHKLSTASAFHWLLTEWPTAIDSSVISNQNRNAPTAEMSNITTKPMPFLYRSVCLWSIAADPEIFFTYARSLCDSWASCHTRRMVTDGCATLQCTQHERFIVKCRTVAAIVPYDTLPIVMGCKVQVRLDRLQTDRSWGADGAGADEEALSRGVPVRQINPLMGALKPPRDG